jgi:hypothetical protein
VQYTPMGYERQGESWFTVRPPCLGMTNTLKPPVHPICQLCEDVAVAAGALRYQNVGSIESVEEVDQLQAFAASFQTCMPEGEVYFGTVG